MSLFFFIQGIVCFGSVESVIIVPEDPVQGDTLNIFLEANPNEEVIVEVSYDHKLNVSDGLYLWRTEEVEIPVSLDSFKVIAENVELLSITTKLSSIPISITRNGIDGMAEFSYGEIPSGSYWMEISGIASEGAEEVLLFFNASSTITTDSNGNFVYSASTSNIPPGDFTARIGNINMTVHLASQGEYANSNPIAVSLNPETVYVGDTVLFDASSSSDADGDVVEYNWSLGDGTVLSGITVSHIYTESGVYYVNLTIVDDYGETGTASTSIKVINPDVNILADAGPDQIVIVNEPVLLNASNSHVPDGEPLNYNWSINGTVISGKEVYWIPETRGIYIAQLTVTDESNRTGTDEANIQVIDSNIDEHPLLYITPIRIPEEIFTRNQYRLTWSIKNNGDLSITDQFTLMDDEDELHSETLEIAPDEIKVITYIWRPNRIGTHNMSIASEASPENIDSRSTLSIMVLVSRNNSRFVSYLLLGFIILLVGLVSGKLPFFKVELVE